jgi:pimeloyl-ACP methyl ester carboxylesterase
MGHTVLAPSLTGLGDRKHLLRSGINLDTHTDDIVNLIEMEELSQVVLVGWSYGGMVTTNVLARVPQRIGSIVYLDAFMPERGRSAASYTARNSTDATLRIAAEGKDLSPLSVESLGVTDRGVIDYVTPRLSAHPALTFLEDSKASTERPKIPHTYVLAAGNPSQTFRNFHSKFKDEHLGDDYVLNTSHVMMLTDAPGTLEILAKVR